MARVTWSDAAIDNIDRIADYIELFDPEAARSKAERLVVLGESLADFPNRGRRARPGLRELTTVRPFILIYKVPNDIVTIVGVRHSAQRSPE